MSWFGNLLAEGIEVLVDFRKSLNGRKGNGVEDPVVDEVMKRRLSFGRG